MGVREHQNGNGKHWRDALRHRLRARRHVGAKASGTIVGATGTVIAVREETSAAKASPRIVHEEAFDLKAPDTLKERLIVRVKENIQTNQEGAHLVSRVLVLSFRGGYQQGIKGLLLTPPVERDLARRAWTHVTIERLPERVLDAAAGERDWTRDPLYEERDMRITWWRHGAGGHRRGEKDGEVVTSLCDELNVLQWITENGLTPLYEIPYLRHILPLRDEDRERQNGFAAQVHTLFGADLHPVPEYVFHRARLWHRLCWLIGKDHDSTRADEEKVLERYVQTVAGSRTAKAAEQGLETGQRFFVHLEQAIAIAVYCWPNYREAVVVNLVTNEAKIGPLEVNGQGLAFYEEKIHNEGYEEIDLIAFHDLIVASHAGDFATS